MTRFGWYHGVSNFADLIYLLGMSSSFELLLWKVNNINHRVNLKKTCDIIKSQLTAKQFFMVPVNLNSSFLSTFPTNLKFFTASLLKAFETEQAE